MAKRIESRLQALEKSKQAQQARGWRCFTQSLSDPAVYHEGTLSMGMGVSAEAFSLAEIEAISAQGWQVVLLAWESDWREQPGPGEQRVLLAWE